MLSLALPLEPTMRSYLINSLKAICLAGVVVFAESHLLGQIRSSTQSRSVGLIEGLGRGAASRTFRAYSFGVGNLSAPPPGAGSGVLRSSIGTPGSLAIRRSRARGLTSGAMAKGIPSHNLSRAYATKLRPKVKGPSGPGFTYALGPSQNRILGTAGAYMDTFKPQTQGALSGGQTEITSLVPNDGSVYSSYLEAGEQAFHEGNFDEAHRQFKLANLIVGKDPESLLSQTHSAVAKSTLGYSEAALYLRRALKYFPELPLAPLNPRAFYGNSPSAADRYRQCLANLEDYVAQFSSDVNARLVLAYFRWFDGQENNAAMLLHESRQIAEMNKDTNSLEAIDIFLDAAESTEKLTSQQSEKAAPNVTSRPAG